MKLKIVSKEAYNINIDDVKSFLRVTDDTEDGLINLFIQTACKKAEEITNRALSLTTFELYEDKIINIELPKPPFIELKAVEVLQNGTYTAIDYYTLDDKSEPAVLMFENTTECNDLNCLKITYTAGYSEIPGPIKNWVFVTIGTLYENREQISDVSTYELPNRFIDSLLDSYKVRFV